MRVPAGIALLALGGLACHAEGGAPTALYPAGTNNDDGHGLLGEASSKFMTGPGSDDPDVIAANMRATPDYNAYGGDPYGGNQYGGDPYGGDPYGGLGGYGGVYGQAPWSYSPPAHQIRYEVQNGLSGTINGVVSWAGPPPQKLQTSCGLIDNPSIRVTDTTVGGALVYIENVRVGRNTTTYGKPASVGGIVAKRGCALVPAAQIVTPMPASFSVHGDGTKAKLKVTLPTNQTKPIELQEAGVAQMSVDTGITRVESEDGKMSAAWLLGLDTPYYAITDDAGRFELDELAPGTYDVTVWQAPLASAGPNGTIVYGQPIIQHHQVKVEDKKPARLDVALKP